jgi:hypothetical protein
MREFGIRTRLAGHLMGCTVRPRCTAAYRLMPPHALVPSPVSGWNLLVTSSTADLAVYVALLPRPPILPGVVVPSAPPVAPARLLAIDCDCSDRPTSTGGPDVVVWAGVGPSPPAPAAGVGGWAVIVGKTCCGIGNLGADSVVGDCDCAATTSAGRPVVVPG